MFLQVLPVLCLQPSCFCGLNYSCSDGKVLPDVVPTINPKRVCWLLADKGACETAASIWVLVIVNTQGDNESSKSSTKLNKKYWVSLVFYSQSPVPSPSKWSRFVPIFLKARCFKPGAWCFSYFFKINLKTFQMNNRTSNDCHFCMSLLSVS